MLWHCWLLLFTKHSRSRVSREQITRGIVHERWSLVGDQVAIDVNIPTNSGLQAEPTVTFRRCESLRLKPCRNLRLIGPFLLAAECLPSGSQLQRCLPWSWHLPWIQKWCFWQREHELLLGCQECLADWGDLIYRSEEPGWVTITGFHRAYQYLAR